MSLLAADGVSVSSSRRVNCRRPASLRRPTSETDPRATRDERRAVTRACCGRRSNVSLVYHALLAAVRWCSRQCRPRADR